jgi:hypothetical protein
MPSARVFADAIAHRLDRVVPDGFCVVAVDGYVGLRYDGTEMGGTKLKGWIDDTSDADELATAARACLDAIQDGIVHVTTWPWPENPHDRHNVPNVKVVVERGAIRLSYEARVGPVLSLDPIDLDELDVPARPDR